MELDPNPILARYPAWARPASASPEPLGNAGGASGARLWRFPSGRGPLVLRAWPADGPSRTRLKCIHSWLDDASPLGFIPAPVVADDGRTVQEAGGRLWELAPWMPGEPDPHAGRSTPRLRSAFAGLAAFHLRLGRGRTWGPSPGLVARALEIRDLLSGGVDRLAAAVDRAPGDPHAAAARRWLAGARRLAPGLLGPASRAAGREGPLQPCIRDARADHFLFEGDRLSGLVDFGAMDVDSVAADLARLLADWAPDDRPARAEALDAYAAVRPLEPAESELIPAYERTAALLAGARWVSWHFAEGRRFQAADAVASGLRRAIGRLERLDDASRGVP